MIRKINHVGEPDLVVAAPRLRLPGLQPRQRHCWTRVATGPTAAITKGSVGSELNCKQIELRDQCSCDGPAPGGREDWGDSRRFDSITCIILNRQLSRKLLDSRLSAAESQEFVGRQRIFCSPSMGGVYYVTIYAVGLADPAIIAGAMDWCRYRWLRGLVVPDLEYLAGFGWPFLTPDGK